MKSTLLGVASTLALLAGSVAAQEASPAGSPPAQEAAGAQAQARSEMQEVRRLSRELLRTLDQGEDAAGVAQELQSAVAGLRSALGSDPTAADASARLAEAESLLGQTDDAEALRQAVGLIEAALAQLEQRPQAEAAPAEPEAAEPEAAEETADTAEAAETEAAAPAEAEAEAPAAATAEVAAEPEAAAAEPAPAQEPAPDAQAQPTAEAEPTQPAPEQTAEPDPAEPEAAPEPAEPAAEAAPEPAEPAPETPAAEPAPEVTTQAAPTETAPAEPAPSAAPQSEGAGSAAAPEATATPTSEPAEPVATAATADSPNLGRVRDLAQRLLDALNAESGDTAAIALELRVAVSDLRADLEADASAESARALLERAEQQLSQAGDAAGLREAVATVDQALQQLGQPPLQTQAAAPAEPTTDPAAPAEPAPSADTAETTTPEATAPAEPAPSADAADAEQPAQPAPSETADTGAGAAATATTPQASATPQLSEEQLRAAQEEAAVQAVREAAAREAEKSREQREREREERLRILGAAAAGAVVGALIPELGGRLVEQQGDRVIIQRGDQFVVHKDETQRIAEDGGNVQVEQLAQGRTRITVTRPDGTQIITLRDAGGYLVRRVKRLPNGDEVVLFDERETQTTANLDQILPPVNIQRERYTVELGRASQEDIRRTLMAPTVVPIDQTFSLRDVRENVRVRSLVPAVNLDVVTFATNSAQIDVDQIRALDQIGRTLASIVTNDPREIFLIEGHTDAVGSDLYNLTLSDRRAETVAQLLTSLYRVPPENLITQGYGEQYLKIPTLGPERQNRRVVVRRITPLLQTSQR